jgi:hypothetical protein
MFASTSSLITCFFGETMQAAQPKSSLLFWCFATAYFLWLGFMAYLAFLPG